MKTAVNFITLVAIGLAIGALITLPLVIQELSGELRAINETLKSM